MDANQTCEILLSYIKKSNLNWSIAESPFTVTVTLKKSFIKNKDGSFRESGLDTPNFTSNSSSTHQLQQIHKIPMKITNDPYTSQSTFSTTLQQALANPTTTNMQHFPFPANFKEKHSKPNISSDFEQPKLLTSLNLNVKQPMSNPKIIQQIPSPILISNQPMDTGFKDNLTIQQIHAYSSSHMTFSESMSSQNHNQLKTTPTQDQLHSTPTQDQVKTTPTLDQLNPTPTQNQVKTTPNQDQPNTTPSQDQMNTPTTKDQLNITTTKDQLNYTATQDQLAIFTKFNPISEDTFPFKYKPRILWDDSDSDVDYSDDEETIDDLMRKLELKYQIT